MLLFVVSSEKRTIPIKNSDFNDFAAREVAPRKTGGASIRRFGSVGGVGVDVGEIDGVWRVENVG